MYSSRRQETIIFKLFCGLANFCRKESDIKKVDLGIVTLNLDLKKDGMLRVYDL